MNWGAESYKDTAFSRAKSQFPDGFWKHFQIKIFKCYILIWNLILNFFLPRKKVVAFLIFKLTNENSRFE